MGIFAINLKFVHGFHVGLTGRNWTDRWTSLFHNIRNTYDNVRITSAQSESRRCFFYCLSLETILTYTLKRLEQLDYCV